MDSSALPRVLRWTMAALLHAAVLYARGMSPCSLDALLDVARFHKSFVFPSSFPANSLRAIEALERAISQNTMPQNDQIDPAKSASKFRLSAECIAQWRASVPVFVVGGASADAATAAGWTVPLDCRVRLHL
jgi:hypothetical protein